MRLSKKIINRLKNNGFTYSEDDGTHTFAKYSSYGQDFFFEVAANNKQELIDEVYRYYEGFDPSQEAYYWLDETGHGKNGAPYEMTAVYADMEECEQMIYNVYEILTEAA